MKKRRMGATIIILIVATILFLAIFIAIGAIENKVIEKDKGVLYNLGNIFSFRWLVHEITVVSIPSSSNGAELVLLEPCFGTSPRWDWPCALNQADFYCRRPVSDSSIIAGVSELNFMKNYYFNSNLFYPLHWNFPCYAPWNPDTVNATFLACDLDKPAYVNVNGMWNANGYGLGQVQRWNGAGNPLCPDDIRKVQCATLNGNPYSFLVDGSSCDSDSDCYKGDDNPEDRPYISYCKDFFTCPASNPITCAECEKIKIKTCQPATCGDGFVNTGLGEDCDNGKFCENDLDKPCETDIDCRDPNNPCYEGNCTRCIVPDATFDGSGSLAESSLFATDTAALPPVPCSNQCKCVVDKEYLIQEKKCYKEYKSETASFEEGIETVIKEKWKTVFEVDPVAKCVWKQLQLTEEEKQPKREKCGICQSCGNYVLAGSATVSGTSPTGVFPYKYPMDPSAGIPFSIYFSVSVNNDDSVNHTYIVQVVNDDPVSIIIVGSSSGIIKAKTQINIKYYMMISSFCGNRYPKIIVRFAGKQYVYQLSYFMKGGCKCGEKKMDPPVECVNSMAMNDEKDIAGLKTKILDPNNPGDLKKAKVCRWGSEVPICQAIETGFDFYYTTSILLSHPEGIGEQEQKDILSQSCQCYLDGQVSSTNTDKIDLINDNEFNINYPNSNSDCYYETKDGKKSYNIKNSVLTGGLKKNICDLTSNCILAPALTPIPQGSSSGSSGGGTATSSFAPQVTFSQTQLISGVTQTINPQQLIIVQIPASTSVGSGGNGGTTESHTIQAILVSSTQVRVTVSSNPQEKIMSVGEEWKIDVNNDGSYELLVKLEKIQNNRPVVSMKAINETIAKSETAETPAEAEEVKETPQSTAVQENPQSDKIIKESFISLILTGIIVCIILLIWKPWKNKKR